MLLILLLLGLAAPETFKGKPATPKITTPFQRRFRTQILEGARKGPNFAARYTIVQWGCGASCVSAVIVDAKSGAVHELPFQALTFGAEVREPFSFRLDSNLLVVRGCPNEKDCATYQYEWRDSRLRFLKVQ